LNMKKIIILPTSIFLGFIILLVILSTVKDRIIKSSIQIASRQVMGVETVVDHCSLSIIKQSISIKGLRLYQPESFPEDVFIDIAEINTTCNLSSLLRKEIHIPKLVLNINKVVLIKDKSGNLNVDALKISREKAKMAFRIDEMILTIDKVIYKKYGKDDKPVIKAFDIGIKEKRYENISSPQQLAGKIIGTVMTTVATRAGLKSGTIYGVAAATGIGMVPLATKSILFGKDYALTELDQNLQEVYETCVATLKKIGEVSKENKEKGIIKGKASGCGISIKLTQTKQDKTQIKVSARKRLLSKPETAGGILHEITKNLKK